MNAKEHAEKLKSLKSIIETKVFIPWNEEAIADRETGAPRTNGWLFDFRRVVMKGYVLDIISELFLHTFKGKGVFQIGGLEVASIPIITGIVANMHHCGIKNANGFFIRKSRKKDGLLRMIEGEIDSDKKIILVDDIMFSGKTMIRQIEVLEGLGYKVDTIWTILRFRDVAFYSYFIEKGIQIKSIFELNDFTKSLNVKNISSTNEHVLKIPFTSLWTFASENPNYFYVVPKSAPILDDTKIFFGSDNRTFWALNQTDGSRAWSYTVGFPSQGKSIFSSPAILGNTIFFGAYDGNFYALDKDTGRKKWIFFEADWIGSSPAVAEDLNIVFVGLEFGLLKKCGGIVALQANTGRKIWEYRHMSRHTHSSPLYIQKKQQVVIGNNDGCAYLFEAKTGSLLWKYETSSLTNKKLSEDTNAHDIKESFTYDEKRDYIIFGNHNGALFFIDRKTGKEVFVFTAEFGFNSTPLVNGNTVLASSLDKNLYCIDLDTGKEVWRWSAGARIFASPVMIEGSIYIGANTGRLTEIDPETGKELSFITVPERITNKVAYNEKTKRFFVPTFANEIYCLEKKDKKE